MGYRRIIKKKGKSRRVVFSRNEGVRNLISIRRSFFAYLDEMSLITVLLPYSYYNGESTAFRLKGDNHPINLVIESKEKMQHFVKYKCRLNESIQIGQKYEVEDANKGATDLQIGAVIRTASFDEEFYYDGPLGVDYSSEKSIFYLWAPTAQQVKLVLKSSDPANEERRIVEMERQEKGVWKTIYLEDIEGWYYSYLVLINLEWKEAIDPYAVAVSVNGETGVIVDLNKTKRQKPVLPALEHAVDSVIYEAHIRDLTIHPDSGIRQKGKYLGVTELNTKTKKNELSGLSYIKDLGITHIEFLPVHDFEEVDELEVLKKYNWGYNPSHYNVPEGSYSTNPPDPYVRINELKEMIHAVQEQGIRVILDVVYNHVYKKEDSSFEKIVPGYFFRYDKYGMPSNGTGVGNDIASERSMVRRFIVDSVRFWIKEYQIDGLRFDLMGILDCKTMNEVRSVCNSFDKSILIIGEGWDLATPLNKDKKAIIANQHLLPRIGQFNDQFRDKLKGSTFQLYDRGYALGNKLYKDDIPELLAGSVGVYKENGMFIEPGQSVNYVESHDNHTLWDKIEICFSNESEEWKQKKQRLATSLVLLSQGIPFIHSGQEFFRTKNGVENSYQSPDEINQLDWDRKDQFIGNVEYIKGLISLRRNNRAFRLPSVEAIQKHLIINQQSNDVIQYILHDLKEMGEWESIIVFINVNDSPEEGFCKEECWNILVEGDTVYRRDYPTIHRDRIMVKPVSITIIAK